jgi:hypothetical protein
MVSLDADEYGYSFESIRNLNVPMRTGAVIEDTYLSNADGTQPPDP